MRPLPVKSNILENTVLLVAVVVGVWAGVAYGQDAAAVDAEPSLAGDQLKGAAPRDEAIAEAMNAVASNMVANQEVPAEDPGASSGDILAESSQGVEINGDRVEFLTDRNTVVADGNVSIIREGVELRADRVEFDRGTNIATATGNVVLLKDGGELHGDKMNFNYNTMTGDFVDAHVYASPFYGAGKKMEKVGENHIQMTDGYMTTCDHDKPHFKVASRKVDVYPGDKVVARNIRLMFGNVPVMYLPKFSQRIDDKRPVFTVTPGYKKDWGLFLLSQYRMYWAENVRATLRVDYRTRKDWAEGLDVHYETEKYGSGLFKTYYTKERDVGSKHQFWEERLQPTPEHERFRAEWRHKWDVDARTSAIWQYYKISDSAFLKDYFEKESDEEISPDTYFLLTRGLDYGTLTFQMKPRVNRFQDVIEKQPEISYDLPNQKLGSTNLYLKNTSTYTNFSHKTPRPSDDRRETMRLDQTNQLSYPMRVSIFEIKPYVGGRQTYYSKTLERRNYNSVRGIFLTGSDLSTKFFRIFEVQTNKWGVDVNRLRHVLTPTVAYEYAHDPTIPSSSLDQFDEIDGLTRSHSITFGLENKFQTKRKGKSVDLGRVAVDVPFNLKEDPGKGGFQTIISKVDVTPYSWWSLFVDSEYDTQREKLKTLNLDLGLRDDENDRYFFVGKRFNTDVDDELTTELGYRLNPKWKLVVYDRFDLDAGSLLEQDYVLRRDLHDWDWDIRFNQTRGQGSEIMLVFTLKAFPEFGVDVSTGFNRRKPGAAQ